AGTFSLNGGTSSVNKFTALKQKWYDYTYWSSPVVNETVNGVLPDTPSDRRFYFNAQNYIDINGDDIDDTGDDWTNASGLPMIPGVGYAATSVNIGPNFPRIDTHTFNGAFNTGDVNATVYFNSLNTLHNWNFIGNPYPSAISTNDFFDDNVAVIEGVAYLWSQSLPPLASNPGNQVENFNKNDYAIINRYSGNVAGASTIQPNNFIPSGQGFFVDAKESGTGPGSATVTFKNASRMPDGTSNSQFFRTAESIVPNKLWVNLTSDNGVFNQILVAYVEGATNNFDGYAYDAPRNLSVGNAAYLVTLIDNEDNLKFAIQGKDPNSLTLDEVIPLGFYTSITQPTIYKLSIANFEGDFFSNETVFLKDNLLNLYHNLSASDYSFTSGTGQFNERFEIVFRAETLSIGTVELSPNDISIIELSNGHVKFNVGYGLTIQSVQIFDMLGRSLYNLSGQNGTEIYNLSNLSQAAYLAKVKLSNGQTISKRAIKRQ
ncbi:MAG: T9SS type A sorting domain-containing protein, partial [Gelidibacter sp.]|nr:T9SS type A sorting domain-containing protein [Gelidibacter sp.]